MKKLTLLLVAIILATTSAFSTDLLFDTNTVKYEELNLGMMSYVHTKIADNKWAIYGIGMHAPEKTRISKHIITEIEYDKATDKVKINSANQIDPKKGVKFTPVFSENTKMNFNQDNGEMSVIRAQPLFTNLHTNNLLRYVPMREVFKDYKLIRSEYDSTFKHFVTIKSTKIIYNDDGSSSLYTYGGNKAWDSVGIYKLNYNSDFTFKNYEFIPMPSIEEVKAKSGVDFTDTVLFYDIGAVNKTKEGTLFNFIFPYNYIKDGKKRFDMARWYMFIDNNNKLQYIITPETLVSGEKHSLNNMIIEYKDYFVFTTNRLGADSDIFSNNLFFIDKITGKVVKNSKFGLKKNLYAFSLKLVNDHLWIIGHHDLNEKYSAGLYVYDIKHNVFRLSSHLGVHYDKVTSIFNGIQLNDNTVYLYGTMETNNFFGVKYKFGESGVDIEASDNTSLKMHGELNRINLMVNSEETALGETTVEVYDITGKLLYSGKHELSSGTPLEIHNPAFVNGVYFVRVRNNAIDLSGKINL